MESNQGQCRMQPSVWFLMGTLLFTSVATAMLCGAIMTDHWEHVTWDRGKLESIALNHKNVTPGSRHKNHHQWMLEWLLDGQVGRIVYTNEEGLRKTQVRPKGVKGFKVDRTSSVSSVTAVEEEEEEEHDEVAVFLIPMHGGIWTLCVSLTEVDCKTDADCKPDETCYHYRGNYNIAKCEPKVKPVKKRSKTNRPNCSTDRACMVGYRCSKEKSTDCRKIPDPKGNYPCNGRCILDKACDAHDKCGNKEECVSGKCTANEQRHLLLRVGFTQTQCINYLDPEMNKGEEGRADWQHRMQNLSISCALVCLIILGSSALVGAFGVLKHQISAVLVTGVMYLLAATFAMFTLTIIHFKRHQSKQKPEKTAADCLLTGGGGSMLIDGVSPSRAAVQGHIQVDADIFTARVFTTSWSLDLGWGGVTLCVLASVLWILLSKIMRYSPLSTLVT